MIKNTKYWIDMWNKSRHFSVENDRIKPKSYLFSSFPKTNMYGFQDGNIRGCLVGDFISRFKRLLGYNVLFPIGYDSLGIQSFIESKKHSNSINDDISNIFKEQMEYLGVGIDSDKEIDLRHDAYLANLQLAFIELYKKGYIKYGSVDVVKDIDTNKYYDLYFLDKKKTKINVNAFYLDISSIFPILERKINDLYISLDIKKELINILQPKKVLNVNFGVTNGNFLNIDIKDISYLGGISFICLNPDEIDFSLYAKYDEHEKIEAYLNDKFHSGIGVFSGNYAINPLTGRRIPIFISDLSKEAVYVGNPAIDKEDYILALDNNLDIIEVVKNGKIINSDFVNGLDVFEAEKLIIDNLCQADMAYLKDYYSKDKILLSSSDAYGALIPFLVDDNDNFCSMENVLPFTFSAKFRPILDDKIELTGNLLEGSINHIFSSGMLPIIAIIYDKIGAVSSIFTNEFVGLFNSWGGIDYHIINSHELLVNVFFPLCILSIIEKEMNQEVANLFKNIIMIKPTYDVNLFKLERSNNNLFDIEKYLNQYRGDSIRFYFLKSDLSSDFIFDEDQLERCCNLILGIEDYFMNDFVDENNNLDYKLFLFKKECLKLFNNGDVLGYVNKVFDFYKRILWKEKITKEQALIFLKLLYPITPFVCEDLYRNRFVSKYLLADDGLNIE